MTTTPAAGSTFEQKYGDFVRKAGSKFGFDLAGLFNDEEESTTSLDGFAPSFSMKTMYKGRSPSTATYKAPKTPSRIAEFSLTPEGTGATAGTVTSQVGAEPSAMLPAKPKVEEKADRLLSSFIGELGTGGSIGAMGVGKAMEYGYTPEQILSKARAEKLTFGAEAARGLGINTDVTSYTGAGSTAGALGQASIERMRASGLSDEAIKSLAQQQGLKFGESAAKNLGISAAQTYQPPAPAAPSIVSYASESAQQASPGAIGLAGIQRAAAAQGISTTEAARRAVAQGTKLGEAARALLG